MVRVSVVVDDILRKLDMLRAAQNQARSRSRSPDTSPVCVSMGGTCYFVAECPHCSEYSYHEFIDQGPRGYCEDCGAVTTWKIVEKRVIGFW